MMKKILTFRQLKRLVNESNNASGPMRYFVRSYEAETEEDVYDEGLNGKSGAFWTSTDVPVDGRFNRIEDVLKAVCDANGFDYDKQNWMYDDENGLFVGDFLVDEDNIEADENDIASWKSGDKRLWNCRISVLIMKSMDAVELDDSDTAGWAR